MDQSLPAPDVADEVLPRRVRYRSPLWLWAIGSALFAVVAVYGLVHWTPAAEPAAATPSVMVDDTSLLPLASPTGDLTGFVGRTVTAQRATVESVPADEGFWVGSGTDRIWVQLVAQPGESPFTVRAGELVTFNGQMVAHDDTFGTQLGLAGADAAQLAREGAHIEVVAAGLGLDDD